MPAFCWAEAAEAEAPLDMAAAAEPGAEAGAEAAPEAPVQ